MRTSEVLNAAADLIEQNEWTQREGWYGQPHAQGVCLEGGIMAAMGYRWLDLIEPTPDGEGWDPIYDGLLKCPAYKAVEEYLGDRLVPGDRLYNWNDVTGRTKEEVIEVLRATALLEAAKENNNTEVTA